MCRLLLMSSTTSQPLFRPQSLRARQSAWLGRPAIAVNLPAAFTAAFSLAVGASIAALVTFGTYTRRVDLHGVVMPDAGLIRISAPSSGWIQSIAVHDGEQVEQNALLYRINVDTGTQGGGLNHQLVQALQAERPVLAREVARDDALQQADGKQLQQKVNNLNDQLAQVQEQTTIQQAFVDRLNSEYTQFNDLLKKGTVSVDEMNTRELSWMNAMSRLEELKASKIKLQADLNQVRYDLDTYSLQSGNQIDALKTKISEIDRQIATSMAKREIEIRSPAGGVVTAVVAHPGQVVGTSSPMLTIVPSHSSMQAELLAPSSAIGFIHPGERVLLRYSAFPYEKFGAHWGTVLAVSHAALRADELRQLDGGDPKPSQSYFQITVRPDDQTVNVYGRQEALPASLQVQAYVPAFHRHRSRGLAAGRLYARDGARPGPSLAHAGPVLRLCAGRYPGPADVAGPGSGGYCGADRLPARSRRRAASGRPRSAHAYRAWARIPRCLSLATRISSLSALTS